LEAVITPLKKEFLSGHLKLEGKLYLPETDQPLPAVVVCHPHPRYGGSMENNVVDAICRSLLSVSICSFKFNFRGVGESQGSFSNGSGEVEDIKAAVSFLASQPEIDKTRLGLAGYSAGAAWGLAAASQTPAVKASVAVSVPLSLSDLSFLKDFHSPLLMISGSEDQLTNPEDLVAFCTELPSSVEYRIIEDADHSWSGFEKEAGAEIAGFFKDHL